MKLSDLNYELERFKRYKYFHQSVTSPTTKVPKSVMIFTKIQKIMRNLDV